MTLGPRTKSVLLWILKGLVALLFIAAASAKILGAPMMVQEFGVIGLGQWFRYFTGAVEITGAVLLLVPRTSWLGALVLFGICVGALAAQVLVLHKDLIHVFVLMAATAFLAWRGSPLRTPKAT